MITALITIICTLVADPIEAIAQESNTNQSAASEISESQNLNRDSNEDILRHALALQERQEPQNQEKLAEARLSLATCLKCSNKLSAARELAELALETQEKLLRKDSKKIRLALMLLSSIYISSNSTHFDEKDIAKLEELLLKLTKIDKEQTANFRVQLAQIYLTQKQPKQAKKQWYQCIQMLHKNLPHDCKDLANACKQIFHKLISDKHFDDAQALARGMTQYGFNQDVLISAANGFVVLSQEQESFGNAKKANHLAKRAFETAEKSGDKKTCSYTTAVKQYAATLRKLGKEEQAKELDAADTTESTKTTERKSQ
jgi:tetratricopeptide (TPR) repeat protein